MTQEEKEILIKDLCARQPYGVKLMKQFKTQTRTLALVDAVKFRVYFLENDARSPFGFDIENPLNFSQQIKPYLRPMDSMTEEEEDEFEWIIRRSASTQIDWYNSKHLDYRGLIPMGLALEAPKDMYVKINKNK